MSEQRPGGGLESGHFSTHARNKSVENESMVTEPTVESRTPAPESERQNILPGSQSQPLAPRRLSANTSTPTPAPSSSARTLGRLEQPARPLLRTSSSASTPDRRPFRPQRIEPPITKTTLSELDVNKIIHNPKLRHDINFDPELHFRPNLDGEKGRRKQEKANQFWGCFLEQLRQFASDREAFQERHLGGAEWCLPQLLKAVKDIIQTLVPQRDREFLDEGLNVELLMQQFNRGVVDLEKLASWLSGVLKRHCAPMRDDWVDEMYNELSRGNRDNDMAGIVKGLRTLLSILEAMKLDVANHQIRCLRPVLIEDTVHFEQKFFLKKIQGGRINIDAAREWYRKAEETESQEIRASPQSHALALGETTIFFHALSRLLLPSVPVETSNSATFPSTFVFDEDRLMKLRSDMFDSICLEICVRQYEELEVMSRFPISFQSTVPAYVADEPSADNGVGDFDHGAPSGSRPSSLAWSDTGSANQSPRNSGCLFGPPNTDPADARSNTRNLYNSLLALLHTTPPAPSPAQRWQSLSQSIALQIMRNINVPHITCSELEDHLAKKLCDIEGDTFREIESHFHGRLMAELAKRVKDFRNLSGAGLFSVATGGRIHGPRHAWDAARDKRLREHDIIDSGNPPREPRDDGGIDEMATRLAHLGILHWRVWAELAYAGDAPGASNTVICSP